MSFVVVEVHEDAIRGRSVRAIGFFDTPGEAESHRRRINLDNYLTKGYWNRDKTYVAKVEDPS